MDDNPILSSLLTEQGSIVESDSHSSCFLTTKNA
jgi:hypothetical protein